MHVRWDAGNLLLWQNYFGLGRNALNALAEEPVMQYCISKDHQATYGLDADECMDVEPHTLGSFRHRFARRVFWAPWLSTSNSGFGCLRILA